MSPPPLCIDLCCGSGGWAAGFIAAGYRVVGFDTRTYPQGYPGQLILQDIRTMDGRRFREARVIVASPPCEEFSRKGLPWHRDASEPDLGIVLFDACRRIIEEAGVPGVIENVRMAQRWVGPAAAHFGSFYLWGAVPLLRPQMRFTKGVYLNAPGKTRLPDGTFRSWRARVPKTIRAPHLRARIPYDLSYWLALELLRCTSPPGGWDPTTRGFHPT